MVNQWLNFNLFRFVPVQCLACGADSHQQALCPSCQQDLKPNLHSCRRCAEPMTENNAHSLCGKCLKQPPEFDLVLSPYLYQAHEISRVLARQFDLPIEYNFCQRQRKTSLQSGLNEKQRRQNIRGAFRVTKKIPYKHVAIVDDVMTTGNTVKELARVLRKGGRDYPGMECLPGS